jgi:hypothetical protein
VRKTRNTVPPELDRLELTIRRLIESHEAWQKRATAAESRVHELETAMQDVSAGRVDPVTLAETVRTLEQRNESLVERLNLAREATDRMIARLQFTAEER